MSHRQYCAFFFFQLKNLYEAFAYYVLVSLWDFTDGSGDKESACNAGDTGDVGLIPGLRRSPGERNINPLPYTCLRNSMDRRAQRAIVQWVTKSWTWALWRLQTLTDHH